MMELAAGAHELLEQLTGSDLDYWTANAITHQSLREMILLDEALQPVSETRTWLQIPHALISSLLPFDQAERHHLAESLKTEATSDPWYEHASSEDVVLVDRWRRWLDDMFDENNREEPDNQHLRLLTALDDLIYLYDHFDNEDH